jgi:FixJ family two-component response regulator
VIYVIDNDPSVRKALERLMNAVALPVRTFASGEEFLTSARPTESDCLVVDPDMPGMSGLELQKRLQQAGPRAGVIFITARENDQTREQARHAGAAGYFRKPIDDEALLDTIYFAIGLPHP